MSDCVNSPTTPNLSNLELRWEGVERNFKKHVNIQEAKLEALENQSMY